MSPEGLLTRLQRRMGKRKLVRRDEYAGLYATYALKLRHGSGLLEYKLSKFKKRPHIRLRLWGLEHDVAEDLLRHLADVVEGRAK